MTSEVFNTDCLEYMRTLPDKAFQLAIADPPYGINAPNMNMGGTKDHPRIAQRLKMEHKDKGRLNSGAGKLKDRVLNTSMFGWDNAVPTQEFFDELRRVCENVIIWGANYFGLAGGMIVWDKMNGHSDQFGCEIAWQSFDLRTDIVHYMWLGMFQGEHCDIDIRRALGQQGNKSLNEQRIHPTQKPVALYAWLLKNYAKPGDRIFDPMMGSQSSRIAAYKMGFDYVGCELDKEYFDKGCERFNRECKGEIKTKDGNVIKQMSLF